MIPFYHLKYKNITKMNAQVSILKSKSRLSASENRKDIDDTHTHTHTNKYGTHKQTYLRAF